MATYNIQSGILYVKLASDNSDDRWVEYNSNVYNLYFAYGTFTA